jgi:hypothetical protein
VLLNSFKKLIFMGAKILAILLFLLSFSVCNAQETARPNSNEPRSPLSRSALEDIVYSVLLEHIYYRGTQTGPDSETGLLPGTLCLRRQTIPLVGMEAIESDPRIAGGAMDDLQQMNAKTVYLRGDGYDVKGALQVMRGGPDIEKFFASAKKKYPGTLAAISLSKIGLSADRTQAIVYAEYFGEKARARKILFLLPMKLYFIPGHSDERIEFRREKIEAIPL